LKDVDLPPHEWKSSDGRAKPREPFFGPGAGDFFLVWVPQFIIVVLLVHYVIRPMMAG
jgi:hypothetical protein